MTSKKEDCFVIMPISDPEGYEKGHFQHVYNDIIAPACEQASYNPIRADDVLETNMIHLDVLKKLLDTPMAVCDLSTRNPNVLFELGLRQAFDKPVVLIQEKDTPKIFDIAPLRFTEYRKERIYHQVIEDQKNIASSIEATKNAVGRGDGINSIVKLLSLTSVASIKEINKAESNPMLQMIMAEMDAMRQEFFRVVRSLERKISSPVKQECINFNDEADNGNKLIILKDMLNKAENLILSSNHPRRRREGGAICEEVLSQTEKLFASREYPRVVRVEARELNSMAKSLLDHSVAFMSEHEMKKES